MNSARQKARICGLFCSAFAVYSIRLKILPRVRTQPGNTVPMLPMALGPLLFGCSLILRGVLVA